MSLRLHELIRSLTFFFTEMDVDTKISKSQKKPGRVQKRNRKTRPSIVFQTHSKAKKGSKRK
jgi:hypothetical protein